jgi:uncharacterized protein YjbI with pentapeptide repeats
MRNNFQEEQKFTGVDFSNRKTYDTEYDNCIFQNCDFSNSDFSDNDFVDCQFENCNFALTKFAGSGLKSVHFADCKLVGINFDVCSDFLFSVGFKNCVLDYSSFYSKKLKKTKFVACSLREVDFTSADLSETVFERCDLTMAIFSQTNLEKADFTTAFNYQIDPEQNRMKKARFSPEGIAGLLVKYKIVIE